MIGVTYWKPNSRKVTVAHGRIDLDNAKVKGKSSTPFLPPASGLTPSRRDYAQEGAGHHSKRVGINHPAHPFSDGGEPRK